MIRKLFTNRSYLIIGLLIIAAISLVYFILNKKQSDPIQNTPGSAVRFTLTDIALNDETGFDVTVRIAEKISEEELKSLAQKVKKFVKASSEKGVVFFTLPGMELSNETWAAVDFTPALLVRKIPQSVKTK